MKKKKCIKKKQVLKNGKIPIRDLIEEERAEVKALRKKRVIRKKIVEACCSYTTGKSLYARKKNGKQTMMRVGQLIATRKKTGVKK